MKEQFNTQPELQHAAEFIHFACTSEDANNVAQATPNFTTALPFTLQPRCYLFHVIKQLQALMIAGARSEVMLPRINSIILALRDLSHLHASQAMMARKFIVIFIYYNRNSVLSQTNRHPRPASNSYHPWQGNVRVCSQAATRSFCPTGDPQNTTGSQPSFFETQLQAVSICAKMNGATGNFSAHVVAAPQVDWRALSRGVIEGSSPNFSAAFL